MVRKRVPTAVLQRIVVVKRWRGAAEGLGRGILAGGLAGALVGATAGDKWCLERSPCEPFPMVVGAAGGALAGALIGPVIGVAVGHRVTIEFENPALLTPSLERNSAQ